jgi:hypothetical protein
MCDRCDSITNEIIERGKPEEDIFYNEKEGEFYLVVEECRYERTRVKIKYCPFCGKKLEK